VLAPGRETVHTRQHAMPVLLATQIRSMLTTDEVANQPYLRRSRRNRRRDDGVIHYTCPSRQVYIVVEEMDNAGLMSIKVDAQVLGRVAQEAPPAKCRLVVTRRTDLLQM
jgi:hypothetical protein